MTTDRDTMVEELKKAGLRLTPQRLAVCSYLDGRTDHPTAQQILDALRPDYPTLSLTTVYAALESLVEAGLIGRLKDIADSVRYDVDPEPHVNVVCESCGTVMDLRSDSAHALEKEVERAVGAPVRGNQIVFRVACSHGPDPGTCPLKNGGFAS